MVDYINIRNIETMANGVPRRKEPTVDVEVSKIVGKKVFATNPKLLQWVGSKVDKSNPEKPLHLLKSEKNRNELKKLLS